MDDLRREPRFPLLLTVRSGNGRSTTENLSRGGMFLQTDELYSLGQTVQLEVSFPGLLDRVAIAATVAWLRPQAPGQPAGIGVALTDEELRRQPLLSDLVAAADEAGPPVPVPSGPYRILIADDSPNTAELYRYAMRKLAMSEWGTKGGLLQVDFAAHGDDAWKQIQSHRHGLVITDLFMPVLDGFGLISRVRGDASLGETRLLVISAGDEEALDRALQLGADGVIHKPARVADVVYTARALLRLRARRAREQAS